jgi:wyosine [tRNA(Phe)-imidazoG37] synthetase (radical SAM superfamily)
MATFLFNDIIFGPIQSRRLGVSLGVNLLPEDYKYCTYDCLYCECGWTLQSKEKLKLHHREEISQALRNQLQKMQAEGKGPDTITFAGNGEPTIHPEFAKIIDDTIALRDEFFPQAKISVLSNATQIHRKEIIAALLKVDQNILKLDSAIDETFQLINRPKVKITVADLVDRLCVFEGKLAIQTLFVKGNYQGKHFDNTTEIELEAWMSALRKIKPQMVMIYPIDRDTPHTDLEKIGKEVMEKIGNRVREASFNISISS